MPRVTFCNDESKHIYFTLNILSATKLDITTKTIVTLSLEHNGLSRAYMDKRGLWTSSATIPSLARGSETRSGEATAATAANSVSSNTG